jgi:hypothetical protein
MTNYEKLRTKTEALANKAVDEWQSLHFHESYFRAEFVADALRLFDDRFYDGTIAASDSLDDGMWSLFKSADASELYRLILDRTDDLHFATRLLDLCNASFVEKCIDDAQDGFMRKHDVKVAA